MDEATLAVQRAVFQRLVDAPPTRLYARFLRPDVQRRYMLEETYIRQPRAWERKAKDMDGYYVDIDC